MWETHKQDMGVDEVFSSPQSYRKWGGMYKHRPWSSVVELPVSLDSFGDYGCDVIHSLGDYYKGGEGSGSVGSCCTQDSPSMSLSKSHTNYANYITKQFVCVGICLFDVKLLAHSCTSVCSKVESFSFVQKCVASPV